MTDPLPYPRVYEGPPDTATLIPERVQKNFESLVVRREVIVLTGTVTWPGGSSESDPLDVPHHQGVAVPAFAMAQSQDGIGTHSTYINEVNATNVNVVVKTDGFTPADTVTTPVVVLIPIG